MDLESERLIRGAVFEYLERMSVTYGTELPWSVLYDEFLFEETTLRLLHRGQGIWKPKQLTAALSILTTVDSPYADAFDHDGLLEYQYATGSGAEWQNRSLRAAFDSALPLVHLQGVGDSRFVATWPVFVVQDDPAAGLVKVAVDDPQRIDRAISDELAETARRAYYTVLTRRRLHQARFRHRVMKAYRSRCAVCRLDEAVLLEAGHIVPDSHELGQPDVSNGLALCVLHHASFDRNLLGFRPDGVVQISPRLRERSDGLVLEHGLQAFHGSKLTVPDATADRPDVERLAMRFDEFVSQND